MSRGQRIAERHEACLRFIRRTSSLPAAMALAKAEGFSAPTTAWIGAMAKAMERGDLLPPKSPKKPRKK